jgi:hypothetical protein
MKAMKTQMENCKTKENIKPRHCFDAVPLDDQILLKHQSLTLSVIS